MWGFFYVARMDEVFTHPTPGSPHIPRRCSCLSSAPGTPAHHRQQGRPCQNQGGASTRADHARHDTRPDAGHAARSAPDTRQATRGRSYRRRVLESVVCVRNCADLDTHKPPCIKSHFCDALLPAQRFCPLQSHTSVIL